MKLWFKLLTYVLVAFWSSVTMLRLAFVFLRHPKSFFYRKKREVCPPILTNSSNGTHVYVTANSIKLHCVTNGTEGKPLMLFLHGFPEFWFSWRFQMIEFSKDFYTVAVDLRGYGDSERPPKKSDYKTETLVEDIEALIPALGYKSCVLVSHDWGGILAWRLVQKRPELIDQFIVMNCPHSKVYMNMLNLKQFLYSWYVFMFQVPYLAELTIRVRDYNLLRQVFLGKRMGIKNKETFDDDILEAYKYTFSRPGACTAAINYYRNMFKIPPRSGRKHAKIEVPILIIWGDEDKALMTELADAHDSVAMNVIVRHIPHCSHWVQQDRPDLVNKYMAEFLHDYYS